MIGAVYLHLWLDGFRYLPMIGPLFLVAAMSAGLLAVVVTVRVTVATAVSVATFATGTLTANLLSLLLPEGLFHFREVGVSYSGGFAMASEIGVLALLGIWTYRRIDHAHNRLPSEPRELIIRL